MRKQYLIVYSILMCLMIAAVGFYIWGIVHDGKSFSEDFVKLFVVLAGLLLTMFRTNADGRRKPLSFYEKKYYKEIDGAFENDKFSRKKLLCALRLYCEDNYEKSLKYLVSLRQKCQNYKDEKALRFFTALVLSDAGYINDAIYEYLDYNERFPGNSTVLNNVGVLYQAIDDNESAEACFEKAIEADANNANAYANLAYQKYVLYQLDEAEALSLKALELKPSLYQAADCLACIYAYKGDTELQKKYYHIAVSHGSNAEELNEAIKNILLEKEETE